jgi:predicted component of type VI protein secretion system
LPNDKRRTYRLFETAKLPETLRLNRASTQHEVKEAVKRNVEIMLLNTDNRRAKHRLIQIMNALTTSYDGPGIPQL